MRPRSKTEMVTDALRTRIEAGELTPGVLLRQRTVAAELGVSATPVREALERLEAEGYVSSRRNGGSVVVRTEQSRLWENVLIRSALEGLAARLAAEHRTTGHLAEILAREQAFGENADPQTSGQLNQQFHFSIYQAAGSPVLMRQLEFLWRSLGPGPQIYRAHDESLAQHRAISLAVVRGDGDAAERLTREHILGTGHNRGIGGADDRRTGGGSLPPAVLS
ncbi:MAG: transcriptional regulator, GntR family [Blastococcus sp.]|jgi:DNA-binding GntR family transcriptional regulator|nr:transcriptional regulator, GntR family [Blastococcus sp.]